MHAPGIVHLDHPLSYVDNLGSRAPADVRLVVIHCTELPDLAAAREYGERISDPQSRTGNSGHWYIDRDGRLERWVDETRIAHHVRGQNSHSIGIELVNSGRWPHWLDSRHQAMREPYPERQVEALIALLDDLQQRFCNLAAIAGHEDLDTELVPASDNPALAVHRKRDPGPQFPWPRVLAGCRLLRERAHDAA